jgi:flagellar motor switch protein FliN
MKPQELSLANVPKDKEKPLEFVHDVRMPCTVEFGRAEITIRKLLALGPGSVIELGKQEGEPVDIRANGNLLARGEVIVVNDKYGVRITEIHNPEGVKEIF